MKRKFLLFTVLVLAGIASIFAGPPGVMPSETTNENATSVAPKFAQIAATKEAPDIGFNAFTSQSNYLREEAGILMKQKEEQQGSPVTESAPKNGQAVTVSMISMKEKEHADTGVAKALTDFKLSSNSNSIDKESTGRISKEVLTDFETTSVVLNSIEGKEDAESIQKE